MRWRWKRTDAAYAVAVATVLAAALVRLALGQFLGYEYPYRTFYPAIVISAVFGGLRGGITATVLAAIVSLLFVESFATVQDLDYEQIVDWVLFNAVNLMLVIVCEVFRRARDTERLARLEVERAAKMKDQFLATVSHELRTPLSAIIGWSQLLRSDGASPEDLKEGLEAIERNALVQSHIVNDLLEMSRAIAGKLQVYPRDCQLAEVIEAGIQTVKIAASTKRIRIVTNVPPALPGIRCDSERIQQVIWNLLSNAIKFTPAGGEVVVDVSCDQTMVQITVRDNGRGIEREFLPHVFDRFRQQDGSVTRQPGLGLGLAIAKELVELHGGTITADSAGPDQGAVFIVRLPLICEVAATRREQVPLVSGPAKAASAASMSSN